MKNSLLGISVICALLLSASGLRAQSPTTASAFTIKNPAGETVTLRIPASGVTPYSLIYPAAQPTVGSLMTFITGGSSSQMAWLSPGTNLQVLQMVGSSPAWQTINVLPGGTTLNATLVWNGTSWVENTNVTMNPSTGDVSINNGGDLTVTTGDVTFPNGVINNNELQNSSVTINTGTGLSGGGVVALGGTLNLANTGVTSIAAGPGISVSGGTGAVTVNNTGVTQAIGTANQVNVSPVGGTGNVTFSLPQDIHTNASPTFDGLTLDALTTNNAATDVIVSTGGVLQTRSISTIGAGTGEPFLTFAADGGSLTNNRVLTAGTGVTITSGGVDNAPTTVAIGQDVATTASPTFTNVTLNGMPSGSTSTDIVVSNGGVLETRSLTSVLPTSGRVSTASATNGGSSWSMVIGNAAVTGTNTIILTYEDPSGGTNKTVHIAGRTVGADFTVQFSGKPAPGSFVNYSILP